MVLSFSVHWEENHDKYSHVHWKWYPWSTRKLWTVVSQGVDGTGSARARCALRRQCPAPVDATPVRLPLVCRLFRSPLPPPSYPTRAVPPCLHS